MGTGGQHDPAFEAVLEETRKAIDHQDSQALARCAEQLEALDTPESKAFGALTWGVHHYSRGETPQALECHRKALDLYTEIGDVEGQARALMNIGNNLLRLDQTNDALSEYGKALDLYVSTGNEWGEARVRGNIGNVHRSHRHYDRALEQYQRALEIASRHEPGGPNTLTARLNIANIQMARGAMAEAAEEFMKVIAEAGGSARATAQRAKNSLAFLYTEMHDYERSLRLFEELNGEITEHDDQLNLVDVLDNYAYVLTEFGRHDEAHAVVQRAMALDARLRNSGTERSTVSRLYVLMRTDRYEEARALLDNETQWAALDSGSALHLRLVRGDIAMHVGDLPRAKEIYEELLETASDGGELARMADAHERLREIARGEGDFDTYLRHNDRCTSLREEISGKNASMRIAISEKEQAMEEERRLAEKQRAVLYSTLPDHVADRLVKGEDVTDHFEMASVVFLDIVGFTTISDRIPAGHVVYLLKAIFKVCDEVCDRHGVTKVKTIGDSYLAVAGVPEPLDDHAQRAARAALEMMKGLNELQLTMDPSLGDTSWTQDVGEIQVRIGLHCGPVVAGIVGDERLQYDVWGDTVNTASRMESSGEPGKIQVSEAFASALGSGSQTLTERGTVDIKGKGSMTTYWLEA